MSAERNAGPLPFKVILAARYTLAGIVLAFLVLSFFSVRFALQFEILGAPVRDDTHGWLGPTPRDSKCVQDIGKVNYWTCSDVFIFRQHELGSRAWLWANGLRNEGR